MSAAISYRLVVTGRRFLRPAGEVTSHYAVGVADAQAIMTMTPHRAIRTVSEIATAFERIDSWELLEVTITETTKSVFKS